MPITSTAQLSSEDRSIGLRTRNDLFIQESVFQGETCWIVKDPLAMKYFRLRKPEYLVLQQLRKDTNYQDLKTSLVRSFPEYTIRLESVQQLVVSLHKSGLLISNAGGQSAPLIKRRNKELQQKAMGLMSSIIALRLPGWDPETFLNWLYPKCRWMFSKWFTFVIGVTCLLALALVLSNFELFLSKLPDFQSFFAFDNILFMGAILVITKSLHELGHGLMCKHFGGECHEIGFMLLVLMPAMYCNTSDSWIMPNRWHRMAIGAAGMYVEIFLAAICTFVWWFTNPGWIHYLALNVMFLSSVSTIVFNANPLLRYDGYYILSDFLEIPNMAQKAKQSLLSKLRVWCLGMKPINPRLLPERNQVAFALYSVSSFVYRWFVLLMIFWFITEIFEPYGLAAIGHVVVGISLFGMVVMPLYKMVKFFLHPGRNREVKKGRLYTSMALLSLLIAFVCFLPFDHYVWASFVVRPQNAQQIILNQPGRLQEQLVETGDMVFPGQSLAVLRNETLELEMKELEVQEARLENDLSAYNLETNIHLDTASKISETQAELRNVQRQMELQRKQLDQLVLRAERAGRIFTPVNLVEKPLDDDRLSSWTGTPLATENRNAYLQANTMLGMIGTDGEMEAILCIDQSDIKLLHPGQRVVALCQPYGEVFLTTELSLVSQDEMTNVPRELSQTNGGPIAVRMDPSSGNERPVMKMYEARAAFDTKQLDESGIQLLPGMRGQAKIRVGQSSIASRIKRYLSSVIKFR